jgi:hypothetical protein
MTIPFIQRVQVRTRATVYPPDTTIILTFHSEFSPATIWALKYRDTSEVSYPPQMWHYDCPSVVSLIFEETELWRHDDSLLSLEYRGYSARTSKIFANISIDEKQ